MLDMGDATLSSNHYVPLARVDGLIANIDWARCLDAHRSLSHSLPFHVLQKKARISRACRADATGGYEYAGRAEIARINQQEVVTAAAEIAQRGITSVVVSGIFSPVNDEQEEAVGAMLKAEFAMLTPAGKTCICRHVYVRLPMCLLLSEIDFACVLPSGDTVVSRMQCKRKCAAACILGW